jgi:uncharacterized delta-60 repeat protein
VPGGSLGFALARYNPNGSLDPTFSGDGRQTTDFGGFDGADGVAIQPNGKVVAAGFTDTTNDFALARYNPNGSLDVTFSGDGKQRTDFGGPDIATGLALQGDGKIVVVGGGGNSTFFASFFALARYNPNGSLDPTFSGDGKQRVDFPGFEQAAGVAVQPDGKIVAVGRGGGGPDGDFLVARLNPNGSLDTSFSGDGKQTSDFGGGDEATAVTIQGNGKIVVVGGGGIDGGGSTDFSVARYNPNGSLDTTFSGDGRQRTDFAGFDEARGVGIQADGKIVAVGTGGGSTSSPSTFALARYNPNGSLDTTFSGDGRQTSGFGNVANGVALQASGKIVAAGHAGTDFGLARYNANGSLDTTFSGDGLQTTDFGFGANDEATGVVVQPDGRVVAAGFAGGGSTGNDFALARYTAAGSLDPTFSGDGKRRSDFGGSDRASGVALQGNGRIVLAGGGLGPDGTSDFALARFLGN